MLISILMSKMIFIKYLPPARLKFFSKIKSAYIFWKLGTFDISNKQISILKSKLIFMKYLPLVRPKLAPKLKMLGSIEIWHIQYFKYADLQFNVKKMIICEIFTTS